MTGPVKAADAQAVPSRGRPRDVTRDDVILDTALELVIEVGYDRLSVGSIAERAGVSKATIYRRWANKAAVVAAAVERRTAGMPPQTRGVDLREDLLTVVSWFAAELADQDVALLGGLFAGMRSDPELAAAMRRTLDEDERAMTDRTVRVALERGETLHPQADQLLTQIAPAVIVHRLVIVGERCDRGFLEHLVDDILLPLLRRQR